MGLCESDCGGESRADEERTGETETGDEEKVGVSVNTDSSRLK
jgi:hypothetical protein